MAFRRLEFVIRSATMGLRVIVLAGILAGGVVGSTAAEVLTYPAPTLEQAREWYEAAKLNYMREATNTTAAWKFAEACFEWAEFARSSSDRSSLAIEGIAAAKLTAENDPGNVAGHFYLAMNKGQLARTKTLGALPLVKEMERSFQDAIKLDPKFDHAAPDRSLGMLYLDAPGWPTSVGSKSNARKHLERAVELSPEYPTNHLTLMEAYLEWEDIEALQPAMERYRKVIPSAMKMFTGARWENSWKDWNARWNKIARRSRELVEK